MHVRGQRFESVILHITGYKIPGNYKNLIWGISSVGRVVTIVTIEDRVFEIQKYNELA